LKEGIEALSRVGEERKRTEKLRAMQRVEKEKIGD